MSEVSCEGCIEAITCNRAKRGMSGCHDLRVLDAIGDRVARWLSRRLQKHRAKPSWRDHRWHENSVEIPPCITRNRQLAQLVRSMVHDPLVEESSEYGASDCRGARSQRSVGYHFQRAGA
jgi:hypothetical protein